MNNISNQNTAAPQTLSTDVIVLILFLFTGVIMFVVYLNSTLGTPDVHPTPQPTARLTVPVPPFVELAAPYYNRWSGSTPCKAPSIHSATIAG